MKAEQLFHNHLKEEPIALFFQKLQCGCCDNLRNGLPIFYECLVFLIVAWHLWPKNQANNQPQYKELLYDTIFLPVHTLPLRQKLFRTIF